MNKKNFKFETTICGPKQAYRRDKGNKTCISGYINTYIENKHVCKYDI